MPASWPGDMLLVERGAHPRDGDIVIAQVDRGMDHEIFSEARRQCLLEAANKDYQPIHPQENY